MGARRDPEFTRGEGAVIGSAAARRGAARRGVPTRDGPCSHGGRIRPPRIPGTLELSLMPESEYRLDSSRRARTILGPDSGRIDTAFTPDCVGRHSCPPDGQAGPGSDRFGRSLRPPDRQPSRRGAVRPALVPARWAGRGRGRTVRSRCPPAINPRRRGPSSAYEDEDHDQRPGHRQRADQGRHAAHERVCHGQAGLLPAAGFV